jgi:Arm DNA-binding domain
MGSFVSHKFPKKVPPMKLTDAVARSAALPAGKTDVIIFDDKQAGFGLRIRAGGKRMWIHQYRFGSVQRRFNIGTIHEMTVAQARDEAATISARVRLGVDPQAERRDARDKASDTLGEIGRRYLEAKKSNWRPGSYREFSRHIEINWAPLARRSVHSIRPRGCGGPGIRYREGERCGNRQSGPFDAIRDVRLGHARGCGRCQSGAQHQHGRRGSGPRSRPFVGRAR